MHVQPSNGNKGATKIVQIKTHPHIICKRLKHNAIKILAISSRNSFNRSENSNLRQRDIVKPQQFRWNVQYPGQCTTQLEIMNTRTLFNGNDSSTTLPDLPG